MALSYWLDSRWGGGSPTAYHVSNVLFHVLTSLLVLGIGRVVGLGLPAATFAGSFFGVLAVHAEAVAWITGRVESLLALMYLLTLLLFALWRRTGAGWLYGVSVGAFILALFSKQSAIMMVGTLVLYDAFVERRPMRVSLARF
jgi:protein O-mannosyl-transferase